jgi:ABC-type Fe3+ transport system substrate-binding protein
MLIEWPCAAGTLVIAASLNLELLKAQQRAEASGYIFFTSHNDIVDVAKKEGKLRVLVSQDQLVLKAVVTAFRKKYPFIDVSAEEVLGTESYQRTLQEIKTGLANMDVTYLNWDSYADYLPYLKKFDVLGMAERGVLQIPPKMIDPIRRNVVAVSGAVGGMVYNREIVSSEKVPNTVEDFLKPEFKGKKFALDVRSPALPALVPFWGLEKVLEIARKLTAQDPIWFRGATRGVIIVSAGEAGLVYGINYKTWKRQQKKDARKILDYKLMEPAPARLSEAESILNAAANPHTGLLWLEFLAGPEGQKILDESDLAASFFSPGSAHEQIIRGKKLSVVDWEHFQKTGDYSMKIVEAMGFPRVEKK